MALFTTISQYLSACDLAEHDDKLVTIRSVTEDSIRQDDRMKKKWVLHFDELDSGLPLNKTNGNVLTAMFGKEMTAWIGQQISIYVDHNITFDGAQVSGIRIRLHA